jgi:hypothetical protein
MTKRLIEEWLPIANQERGLLSSDLPGGAAELAFFWSAE